MKKGDLVRQNYYDSPMMGVILRIKSWETLNDMAIVYWNCGTQCSEYTRDLEVISEV